MKRALFALVFTLGALLIGSPSSLHAQNKDDPAWIYMPESADGTTFCTPGGVRSVVDMEDATGDPRNLAITVAHETVHQRQLRNRSLCNPTWAQLLSMETEAYCEADAHMARTFFDTDPKLIYTTILSALQHQFFGAIPSDVVTRAWANRCGEFLGILPSPAADGTSVKTLPVGPNK